MFNEWKFEAITGQTPDIFLSQACNSAKKKKSALVIFPLGMLRHDQIAGTSLELTCTKLLRETSLMLWLKPSEIG